MDLTAHLLSEVCKDVAVVPKLNELSGETFPLRSTNVSDEARLDVSARGVWTRYQRAFFYIRVFDPLARRYQDQTLRQAYLTNEKKKKRHYNARILEVENGTFTPLVFSVYGGMGNECQIFMKRLSLLLSEKRAENYSMMSTWIRTKLSFALLRSCLMCIRGSRHHFYRPNITETDVEIDVRETTIKSI